MKRSSLNTITALCLLLSLVLSSCGSDMSAVQSTPSPTPAVSPSISTPTNSYPVESPSAESTPEASTPTASESNPETTSKPTVNLTPGGNDPKELYVYKVLPDAFTEITDETRSAIEAAVGISVKWDKHFLGIHKGYIIFGIYDEKSPELYRLNYRYFGKITELYGYKDGELRTFKELYEGGIFDMEFLAYIAYIGLEKEIVHNPIASDDLEPETIAALKVKTAYFERYYYGMCGGYIIFGDGNDYTGAGYNGNVRDIQNHSILYRSSVWAYHPNKGFVDFFTLCNENRNIDYEEIVNTILIAAYNGVPYIDVPTRYFIHQKETDDQN